jgi:hypothetical protein
MSFISFIEGLFGINTGSNPQQATSAENLYQNLLKEEQNAATWVSGTLAIINQNITIDAPLLVPIIKSVFPNVDAATIESTFVALASKVTQVQGQVPTTLEGAITEIQQYLIPKKGNDWIIAVQGLFSLAVTIVSPVTPVQKIVAVAEYVYQDIITPLLGLHKSSTPIVIPSGIVNAPVGTVLPNGNMVVESAADAIKEVNSPN